MIQRWFHSIDLDRVPRHRGSRADEDEDLHRRRRNGFVTKDGARPPESGPPRRGWPRLRWFVDRPHTYGARSEGERLATARLRSE